MLKYETYLPCNELSDLIDLIEVVEVPANHTPIKVRILPDDRNYLIFNYGSPFYYKLFGIETQYRNRFFISGITPHYAIGKITGFTGLIAVRFTPLGLQRITNKKASWIANKFVKAIDVIDFKPDNIEEVLLNTCNNVQRIKILEDLLLNLPVKPIDARDENFTRILRSIISMHGKIQIHDLTEQFHLSYTHLEKLFKKYIGISPKTYCKLLTIISILELGKTNQETSFTELAHCNGYFDQSHFIKDFKRFIGLNPKKHLKANKFFGSSFVLEE